MEPRSCGAGPSPAIGAEPISGTDGARQPAWIPGRREVSFFVGDALKRTDSRRPAHRRRHHHGCRRRRLVRGRIGAGRATRAARWSAGGPARPRRPRASSRATSATAFLPESTPSAGCIWPNGPTGVASCAWSATAPSATSTDADGHAIAAAGWLLYPRGGALLAQRLRDDGAVEGARTRWSLASACPPRGRTFAALSPRVAVFAAPGQPAASPAVVRRAAAAPRAIASEPGDYWQVRLSPDDRQAAVTMLEPLLRTLDVYVLRGGSGAPVPVTLGLAADTDPVWSPDGRRLLFRSVRNGQAAAVHTGGRHRGRGGRTAAGAAGRRGYGEHPPSEWSRAGDMLFSATSGSRPNTDIFRVPGRARASQPPPLATGLQRVGRAAVAGRPLGGLCLGRSRDSPTSTCRGGRRARARASARPAARVRGGRAASLYFLRAERSAARRPAAWRTPGLRRPAARARAARHPRLRRLARRRAGCWRSSRPRAAGRPDVGAIVDWPSALAVFP